MSQGAQSNLVLFHLTDMFPYQHTQLISELWVSYVLSNIMQKYLLLMNWYHSTEILLFCYIKLRKAENTNKKKYCGKTQMLSLLVWQ